MLGGAGSCARYVCRWEVHVDYFVTAIFSTARLAISLGALTWWLVAAYYFAWVDFGGRTMAIVYSFAHREGHAAGRLYRPWIANSAGNIFENRLGVWYGIVLHIFSMEWRHSLNVMFLIKTPVSGHLPHYDEAQERRCSFHRERKIRVC